MNHSTLAVACVWYLNSEAFEQAERNVFVPVPGLTDSGRQVRHEVFHRSIIKFKKRELYG